MYTPVHTLRLCYPASLIDYARVFQGLTDETREDLWDDDTRETVARLENQIWRQIEKGEENDFYPRRARDLEVQKHIKILGQM